MKKSVGGFLTACAVALLVFAARGDAQSYVDGVLVFGGTASSAITAPSYTATAAAASSALIMNTSAKLCGNGSGCTATLLWNGSYWEFAGGGVSAGGGTGSFYGSSIAPAANGFGMTIQGSLADAAAVTGVKLQTNQALTAAHDRYSFRAARDGGTNWTFTAYTDGTIAVAQEFLVDKVSSGIGAGNLLATGTNYSGFKVTSPWTLTHMSINVTTASSATAANTVLTSTDGTNTCTWTFACNTDTNTTGVKDKAGVNGAGTGCVYATGALVTWSVTTQGCATAITTNAIGVWGKPQ